MPAPWGIPSTVGVYAAFHEDGAERSLRVQAIVALPRLVGPGALHESDDRPDVIVAQLIGEGRHAARGNAMPDDANERPIGVMPGKALGIESGGRRMLGAQSRAPA